jgi:hypothetical protein
VPCPRLCVGKEANDQRCRMIPNARGSWFPHLIHAHPKCGGHGTMARPDHCALGLLPSPASRRLLSFVFCRLTNESAMRQTSGYAIVRMPTGLVAAYDEKMRKHQAAELFQQLCERLKPLPRSAYRGTSRFPLMPFPSTDPDVVRAFEESGCDMRTEQVARRRFAEIQGTELPETDFDDDLLADLPAAREVFSLLTSPKNYEIVEIARAPFIENANTLGFDVGYWGGDHYSIICDSAVRPTWHPPQPECFEELALQLRMVNESFLFPSVESASVFRSWYRTQYWAETESRPDEFCIIQVNQPPPKCDTA